MVADAPEAQENIIFLTSVDVIQRFLGSLALTGIVTAGESHCRHFGTIITHPGKLIGRQLYKAVAASGSHKHITVVTAFCHNLNQTSGVSKGIHIHSHGRLHPEFLLEILSSGLDLAHERLSAWHVAVRLKVPAAHNVPLLLLHQAFDLFKKLRRILLDPLIQQCLIVAKNKMIVFLTKISCNLEG